MMILDGDLLFGPPCSYSQTVFSTGEISTRSINGRVSRVSISHC